MMRLTLRVASLAAVILCGTSAWAQAPFRRLNVVALDKNGQPVTDLSAGDLQLTDNGAPLPVVSLHLNDNRPGAPAPLAPHQYSNQSGSPRGTTVILFDLMNGAGVDPLNGPTRDLGYGTKQILEALQGIEDPSGVYLYILTANGTLYPVRGVPTSLPAGGVSGGHWTSHAKELLDHANREVRGFRSSDQQIEALREITSYQILMQLGAATTVLPGPKSIVWLTRGFPLSVSISPCHDLNLGDAVAPCMGRYVDFTPVLRIEAGRMVNAGISVWPVDESWSAAAAASLTTLETFAGLTGGKMYSHGETAAAVAEASAAMRMNYTLAYRPAQDNWDGKFHKVKVTCSRKDVRILTANGYAAEAPADQTRDLMLAAAHASSDIPEIGISAAASGGKDPYKMRVQVRIGPPGLFLVPQDGHFTGDLALAFVGLTDNGPVELAKLRSVPLNMSAAELKGVENGITEVGDLEVSASVRQVRAIVVDRWGGRVGSLTMPKSW